MTNTYLSFIVHNELYAINVVKVLEVLEKQEFTQVPNAPDVIKGIINFRGDVVPVYETRAKFNLPKRAEGTSFVIIVIDLSTENETYRVGAIVDKVKDVIVISDTDIKPVPPMSKEFNADFIQGIVKLGADFVMLFDVEKIFTSTEIANLKGLEIEN